VLERRIQKRAGDGARASDHFHMFAGRDHFHWQDAASQCRRGLEHLPIAEAAAISISGSSSRDRRGKQAPIRKEVGQMKRISPRVTPSMAVALTALVFAMTGAGYAATELAKSGQPHAVKAKKKNKRGPAGPRGPQGPKGDAGVAGSPGAITFTGRMQGLNIATGSNTFGVPSGQSIIVVNDSDASTISPNVPLTAKSLSVQLTAPPATTSIRFFYLRINGNDSSACAIAFNQNTCTIALSQPIPPLATIAIRSEVAVANAAGANARFAWTAQ
jgi:hypothetical protein